MASAEPSMRHHHGTATLHTWLRVHSAT
jgi:hypothetical protein